MPNWQTDNSDFIEPSVGRGSTNALERINNCQNFSFNVVNAL